MSSKLTKPIPAAPRSVAAASALVVLSAILLGSCDGDDTTPPMQVENQPEFRDEVSESDAEEAEQRIADRIAALDRKIEETEDELSQFGDALSEEVREEWRALEDERRALAAEFEDLRAGAYQTLQDAVVSLERRLEEVREDLSEIADENQE